MDFQMLSDKNLGSLYEAVQAGKEKDFPLFCDIAKDIGVAETVDGIKSEILRRWYRGQKEFDREFKSGDHIWHYLDTEDVWEEGTVVTLSYVNKRLDTIGIEFEDGFDSLDARAIGKTLFHSKDEAREFMSGPNMVVVAPAYGELPPVVVTVSGRESARDVARNLAKTGYPADSVMMFPENNTDRI